MSKITFITQFNRTPESVRNVNTVKFVEPSNVKQSLSYATDINTIYDNYCKTGRLPLNGNQPIYDENFINYDSLIDAQNAVKEASSYFANLPTDIRAQYGNKLENFVNAIHTQDNFLVEKGVLKLSTPTVDKPLSDKPVLDKPVLDNTIVQKPLQSPATEQVVTE